MDGASYDWSKFTKRIGISSDLARIYKAWSTRRGLESWFLAKAEFIGKNKEIKKSDEAIEIGDTFTWMWIGANAVEEGEILGKEKQKSLSFTFLGCLVVVSFYIEAGESIVEIQQSGIPTDDRSKVKCHLDCIEGWTFYLANLKSVMEGGLDLRNKNNGIKRVVNT